MLKKVKSIVFEGGTLFKTLSDHIDEKAYHMIMQLLLDACDLLLTMA